MKNIETTETVGAESASAVTVRRHPLIPLIAVFVALCLLAGALAVFTFFDLSGSSTQSGTQNGATGTGEFDYFKANIADYFALTKDKVTGITIPGFESKVSEVTDENVKKYLNQTLLSAVALTDEDVSSGYYSPIKTEKIDYADEVFLYILWVEKANGERVTLKFFDNAYMEQGRVQIGMETFGADFDNALVGLIPAESGKFETRTMGEVGENDIILFSYTVTEKVPATEEGKEDGVKNHENATAERIDLAKADAAWRALVLENYGVIGQVFSFEYEEDIDGDGDVEKVTYEGSIDAVLTEESYISFKATLPEHFFGKNPKDPEYAELNGATLTFYVSIDFVVKHEANTVENMTYAEMTSTLASLSGISYTPSNLTAYNDAKKKVTEAEKAITTYKDNIKTLESTISRLEKEIREFIEQDPVANASKIEKREATLATTRETLATKQAELAAKEAALPTLKDAQEALVSPMRTECIAEYKKQLADSYDASVKSVALSLIWEHLLETLVFDKLPEKPLNDLIEEATLAVESSFDSLTGTQSLYYRDINEYAAAYYFGYDEDDFTDYKDYIKNSLAPKTIMQNLLYPAIYKALINDQKKLDAAVEELIAEIIEYNATEDETTGAITKPTRKEVIDYYGNDYLRNYAISGLVDDYLVENNTIDWDTAKTEK